MGAAKEGRAGAVAEKIRPLIALDQFAAGVVGEPRDRQIRFTAADA
jgi:hypothetical protein